MKKYLLLLVILLSAKSFSRPTLNSDQNKNPIASNIDILELPKKFGTYISEFAPNTIIASEVAPGYSSTNATACFVNAIKSANEGDTVIIDYKAGTNGVWLIEGRHPNWFDGNSGNDQVANNLTIIFEKGVTLKSIDDTYVHDSGLDMLLRLENLSGWKIYGYGAKFEMNEAALPGGESRHAIGLYDCKDILIEGLKVNGSGGDGISISTRTQTGFSENITIRNTIFENHRRQAATIVSANNVLIENVKLNGTTGTPPTSGLDLEPNYVTQRLTNIKIKNVEFANNGYTGILLAITKLRNTTIPLSLEFDGIYVVNNWQEQGQLDTGYKKAGIALGLGGGASNAIQGSVSFNNTLIKDEKYDGIFTVKHHDAYKLVFNDLVIDNVGNLNVNGAKNAIHTSRYNYNSPTTAMGNIEFNGLLIREDRDVPFWQLEGDSKDGWSIDDVVIKDAFIITPHSSDSGINNTTNASQGIGTSLSYEMETTLPTNTLNISMNGSEVLRGSENYFTVTRTRTSIDINYPLSVEYSISGTAGNMDDYNLLHGYAIISAHSNSVKIPINARAKKDSNETITLTLIDTNNYNLGNSFSQTMNIVSGDTGSKDSEVWLEAECSMVGAGWRTITDGEASGGQYLLPPSGNTSSPPSSANSIVTFDFEADAGSYGAYARVRTPTLNDDSFWVRTNGGRWIKWNNIPRSSVFNWHRVYDSDDRGTQVSFDLMDGTNTIDIAHREDGAGLDKLYIAASGNAPTGMGETAFNCNGLDTVPPSVTGISATNVTGISFKVDWTLDEGSTGKVEWGLTSALGNQTNGEQSFLTRHIQSINGLDDGTKYFYRVIGNDTAGNSFEGEIFSVTTLDITPPTVTGISATNVTGISFKVDWTLDEGSTGRVQWGLTSTLGNQTDGEQSFLTHHIQLVKNLTGGTEYYYRVIGQDAAGNSFTGDIFSITTLDTTPPTVTGITTTDLTRSSFNVDWSLDEGSTGRVSWGLTVSLGNWTNLEQNFLTRHIQLVKNLTAGTEYFYRVIGNDMAGNSFTSNILNITTLSLQTSNVWYTNGGAANNSLRLYPNPTSNTISITGIEGPKDILITDFAGRVVHKSTSSLSKPILDMSAYPPGAYYLRVHGLDSTGIFKIIKE